jgi:small subunit ribosomal protein S4
MLPRSRITDVVRALEDGFKGEDMARRVEAVCRLCRRAGEKLMVKGDKCVTKCTLERRTGPPGRHAAGRQKISDYGRQIREKAKARSFYGMMEKQFRRFYDEAERLPGIPGENLIVMLERRLDNVVYKMGFADSMAQARQVVRHGHIAVNTKKTDIPSYLIKVGDVIQFREASKKNNYYKALVEQIQSAVVPGWLSLDKPAMVGRVISLPDCGTLEVKFDEKAIVGFYSR